MKQQHGIEQQDCKPHRVEYFVVVSLEMMGLIGPSSKD